MSALKDRLNRLKKTSSPQPEPSPSQPEPQAPAGADDGWGKLGARLEETDWGRFVKRVCTYPLDYRHGRYTIGQLAEQAGALAWLQRDRDGGAGEGPRCGDILFFDTETTGLGVGAGNVPFMIGIGYYRPDAFVIEQLFIRNPGEELAMLVYLREKLHAFTHVASYNGKSFDWPILKNRYVLNRLEFSLERTLHLDFLYPSRSLWRSTLSSCRLGNVEERRLGIVRADDVPGSLAPALYFQYLSTGDPETVAGVFRHNETDILSLAGLAVHFSCVLRGDFSPEDMSCEELYRLGLWLDQMGRDELARRAVDSLLERPFAQLREVVLPVAALLKKKGRYEQAARLWERAVHHGSQASAAGLEPLIELAMYYEHRRKDIGKALFYAEEALKQAWKRVSMSRGDSKQRIAYEQIKKRMERLRRKQSAEEAVLW